MDPIPHAAHIEILALRTWGNLGNLLAARKLGRRLETLLPDLRLDVLQAEDFCPVLSQFGAAIREITETVTEPATLRSRYLLLMADAAKRFPPGLETGVSSVSCSHDVARLTQHFAESRPDIVISTKGLLSRLCVSTLRLAGLDSPVVNYVTNHGLVSLPIHRSHAFALNLVPFQETKTALVTEYGYRDDNVRVVGPLLSGEDLRRLVGDATDEPAPSACHDDAAVILFANHGGFEYARLLEDCVDVLLNTNVVLIVHRQQRLLERMLMLRHKFGAQNWRVYDSLEQLGYFQELTRAARSDHSFVISKTGPNTVLEAAILGLPVLVHVSGLPMEDWVPQFIVQHGLGHASENAEQLGQQLRSWLTSPDAVARCKRHVLEFAATRFDDTLTNRRLREVFGTFFPSPGQRSH